jgi:hypothetical protein
MRLTEVQSCAMLRAYGAYVTEACDKCGNILGSIRYTRNREKGAWCSQLCRDGVQHKTGVCRGCGTPLGGKRKEAMYCSRTCRMRTARKEVRDRTNIVNTTIQDKGLTDAISRFGHRSIKEQAGRDQKRLETRALRTSKYRNNELQYWSRPSL